MPATANLVQAGLGATRAGACDINAVCSGFVYALAMADSSIRSGLFRTVLVIGAETFSRIVDWTDRSTCVLFGDGAGALLLRATDEEYGLLATTVGSDGSRADLLTVPAGGSRLPATCSTLQDRPAYDPHGRARGLPFCRQRITTHYGASRCRRGAGRWMISISSWRTRANVRIIQ